MVNAPASKNATKKTAPKAAAVKNVPFAHAVGRRKKAVARVWLRKGNGSIVINGRDFNDYFTVETANQEGRASFNAFAVTAGMVADVNVQGGGYTAQASAVKLGIARALVAFDETFRAECRGLGFLTVDARVKERKKYGQRGARAKFQFTKR